MDKLHGGKDIPCTQQARSAPIVFALVEFWTQDATRQASLKLLSL